jgi:dTDP-4-amino-4,6-dideoxygalactose transaminase
MDAIMDIATRHELTVIEDAAQGLMAGYRGRSLGSIAHLGAISFHETKNVISGEGGALLINRPEYIERAEIIREKGTNRSRFLRGEVDKYTWEDIGSSYLPSELVAAFLWAQMEQADDITSRRLALWTRYQDGLAPLEHEGRVRLPRIPAHCAHNAHMYYVMLADRARRERFLEALRRHDVSAVSHYVALHDSTMGRSRARVHGDMKHTLAACDGLARLPFWLGLEEHIDQVLRAVSDALNTK